MCCDIVADGCSAEGELEVDWDTTDLVHMDDAMTVPATGGFYKSVAHHFYEVHNASGSPLGQSQCAR